MQLQHVLINEISHAGGPVSTVLLNPWTLPKELIMKLRVTCPITRTALVNLSQLNYDSLQISNSLIVLSGMI